jgi:hypothetical protein
MPNVERFADRLLAETYEQEECVQLDYGDPGAAAFVPERLFARAQCVARAYDLHLLPVIDIYRKTRLNRAQCEAMLDEVAFVARVTNDDVLHGHLTRIQEVVLTCIGLPQRELVIDGP